MKRIAWAILVSVVILISFHAHRVAGLTLPPPWNDESWSIYPARNIWFHGRLWTPELNPEKVIFCYPMQEMLLGVTWPLHNGDLKILRDGAWVMTALAFVICAYSLGRLPWGSISGAILGAFFLSAPIVVAGNITRPEAPMFLLFSLGMLLSERGHLYKALAMAACAAVLHPTGLIGFGIFGIGSIVTLVRRRQLPSFSDTACWVIPLAMWIYFLQLILRHWNDFFESWYATYSEPMTQSLYSIITNKWLLLVVLPVVVVTITAFVVRRSWVFPSLILVGISLIPVIRTQMWYEVYKSWTLGMLSAMGFSLTSEILRDRFRIPNIMAMSVSLLAVLPILYFSYRHGWLEGPRGYPRDMTWGWGMIVEDPAIPYFTREDEEKILTALRTHTLSQGGRLMVRPDAEALLYRHTFEPLQVYQPVRASVMPDWVLFRRSRYIPPWVRDAHLSGITNSFELAAILHARNETEEWTLWRRKVP